jgi:Asp-tRNA(Asn)/Glu-tRNA(Gln) amidotransferase A subunit family amidase
MGIDVKRRAFLTQSTMLAVGAAFSAALPDDRAAPAQRQTGLLELSAVAAIAAMKKGEIRAEDYASALLDRAKNLERLNAFRTLKPEMVLAAARGADKARAAGRALGALHGLPIPVKDSVNTKTLPTSNGTRALRDFKPKEDAAVLKPLFAAGAILMGKTNLHELSFGWTSNNGFFGPVRNPYDINRVPGGSSGGSGAAVAARMAPLAIGEDTLGSIRVPASMCGLVGLRPSFGRYPDNGIMPLTIDKFDQVGPLARSVGDLVLFDTVVTGQQTHPAPTPLKGVRLGISPEFHLSGLDPEVERITMDALQKLREMGVTIVRAEVPEVVKAALEIFIKIGGYEMMPSVSAFLKQQGTGVSFDQLLQGASGSIQDAFKAGVLPPNRPAHEVYESALTRRAQLREAIAVYFETQQIAALAFPPIMIPPPRIGEEGEVEIRGQKVPFDVAMARNIALGSCASMASLILPAGLTSNRLPVGIEFAALKGKDLELLSLGLSLEQALGPIPAPTI